MYLMTPRISKAVLTTHVTVSVGWVGTVAAFLALSIIALIGVESTVRGCYLAMEIVSRFVILPFCLASLVTGLIQALGTHWGLTRHWWVLVKLILTVISTIILLLHMQPIAYLSEVATTDPSRLDGMRALRIRIIADAGAAILVLVAITTVSVYKPWGRVQVGISLPTFKRTTKRPIGFYLFIGLAIALMIFVILHLMQGSMRH
jgi:hypothetical protein